MTFSVQARAATRYPSSPQSVQRRDGAMVGQSSLAGLSAALNDNWLAHGPGRGTVQRFLAQDYAGFSAGAAANRDWVRGYRQYISPDYLTVCKSLSLLPESYQDGLYELRKLYSKAASMIQVAQLPDGVGDWAAITVVLDKLREDVNGWISLLQNHQLAQTAGECQRLEDVLDSSLTDDFQAHGERESRQFLQILVDAFRASAEAAMAGGDWGDVAAKLNQIREAVILAQDLTGIDNPFSNTRLGNWDNAEAGVEAMGALPQLEQQAPVHGKPMQPNIPVIAWTAARATIPPSLRDLLVEIYLAWKGGLIMDRRSGKEKENKTKNSNTPGALRSWHMNEQKQLPAIVGGDLNHPLHKHYKDNSRKPYSEPADGPIGYAEYTGTGISQDSHYSKIVLNYTTGMVYLTLSHYGTWSPGVNGAKPKLFGKANGAGTNSAWFALDMRQ